MVEHYTNLFFSVSLHVLLLFIFLTIFYWTVITQTEKRSLYSEINNSIQNNLSGINIPKNSFTEDIFNYSKAYYSGNDSNVLRNNRTVFKFNIVIIILIFLIFLTTIFVRYITCNKSISFLEIIIENIIVLIFVGGIEYYFFMNIASKYVPVLPSYIPSIAKEYIESNL